MGMTRVARLFAASALLLSTLLASQPPVAMEFGQTFTALDPDGHRLRIYCPAP